ncbi:hypothetical protein QZH41_000279 [Actinostola sp. cb2023]|nr:hypothetical protein QZH41_000279 [Actinostola sp. cb2023]
MAVISLLLVPALCYYTGKLLIDCLYEQTLSGHKIRVRSTYMDLGDSCWPSYGGLMTIIVQILQLVLSASSCIVLSASLLSHVLEDFVQLSQWKWFFIAAVAALPTVLVRNLSQVAWLNILGITTLFSSTVVITGYGFFTSPAWDIRNLPLWNNEGIPLAISIIVHSYAPHGALHSIEGNMADKSKYKSMLTVTYILGTFLRTVFAINGFFSYYGRINEVISNSLPPGVLITVNSLLIIYSILCYPFQVFSLIHIIETSMSKSMIARSSRRWYIVSRIVVTITTFVGALLVPRYTVLMAISGILKAILAFILPCVFHLKLKGDEMGSWSIFMDFFILAIGIAVVIIGTTVAIFKLIVIY